jgi:hypothetical protein
MTLTLANLQQFTSSETIYRHAMIRKVVYTYGVRDVAREGGAYWLIDEIALAQRFNRKVSSEEFQVWALTGVQLKVAVILNAGTAVSGRARH